MKALSTVAIVFLIKFIKGLKHLFFIFSLLTSCSLSTHLQICPLFFVCVIHLSL